MQLALLWAGRTRDRNLRAAIDDYVGRIGRYMPVSVTEVREEAAASKHSLKAALRKEGKRLAGKIPKDHKVVLLDLAGQQLSSEDLAGFLETRIHASIKGLAFVVGGHEGVDDTLKDLADDTIALSRMTLTHEMARLLLAEQIYRALTIVHGGRYHR